MKEWIEKAVVMLLTVPGCGLSVIAFTVLAIWFLMWIMWVAK